MHAAIYLRQSLDREGNELGVERQCAECRRLADQRGYVVTHVLTDNNRSASTGDRPAYRELLGLIESRAVDVVIVLRVDRLLRRMTELEDLIELSERTGVQIATVQGDLDLTNSSGRMLGRILASLARAEVETKSERHMLANAQKAAAGKPHGSRRPYGYEADLVTIYEPEAAVLREMGRRIMAGHSFKEIAYWANEHKYSTTMGKLWFPLTVRNMLLKKRYAGIRDYKGAEYPAVWQAVFDTVTWERLQLTIRLKREASDVPQARKYLLTGLLFCGQCGNPLNGGQRRDRPDSPMRRLYQCRVQGATQREGGCGGVRRGADPLDDWVTECVLYRLDTPKLGRLLQGSGTNGQLTKLLGDRQAAKQRIDGLVDDYATGLLDRAQFARAKAIAEAEMQRIERELSAASLSGGASGLLPAGESVRKAWESSESDAWKRELLALVIRRIDVNPGLGKPMYKQWKFDPGLIQIRWRC